jgi:hypothetical protein
MFAAHRVDSDVQTDCDTISAAAFVSLAFALAPAVPTALATVHTTITNDDAKLTQTLTEPCAAWFLDPVCSQGRPRKLLG